MCVHGVKAMTSDFEVCDQGSIPNGSIEKKRNAQKNSLKSPEARVQLPGCPLGRVDDPIDIINNIQQQ